MHEAFHSGQRAFNGHTFNFVDVETFLFAPLGACELGCSTIVKYILRRHFKPIDGLVCCAASIDSGKE